jgi:hypothetical protein
MLTPEEKEMLANIKSLVSQIESMETAGGETEEGSPEEPAPVTEAADDIDQMPPEEEAKKACGTKKVKKGDDGTHADDDAEERLDDIAEVDAKNIQEVAKVLVAALKGSAVKKAKKLDPITEAIMGLTRVVKTVSARQEQTAQALASILEGFGIAEMVQKNADPEQPVQKSRKPIGTPDQMDIITGLAEMLAQKKDESPKEFNVRKGLTEVLSSMASHYPINK